MPWRPAVAVCVLVVSGLQPSPAPPRAAPPMPPALRGMDEPITPMPPAPALDPRKVQLGERLFGDRRLSRDDSKSCLSCHDISTNGASTRPHDVDLDGAELPFNTLTVFNATHNFRFGWEGKYREVGADVTSSLVNPRIMGSDLNTIANKLKQDPVVRAGFFAAYGRGPDGDNIVDALVNYEKTLVTPGSRFDRWLEGDGTALSSEELEGYHQFKSLGCVSCHQGVNVGGNLFQRRGIFHPLSSPDPAILRVPSLRNVGTTPPYFHDGSAPTLEEAVRKMGVSQLNATLTDHQIKAIVAFLRSLTGEYRGAQVGGEP
nr:c-type cytochrome [Bradyrhizobium sp. 1(2017)]